MNKMLLILLITCLTFVGIVLFYNYNDKLIQESLINNFLDIIKVELLAMGGIKAFKIKKGGKNE